MTEKIGPRVNIVNICTILPRIATEREVAGVIPKIKAEKTATVSETPRLPGVNWIKIVMLPIVAKNNPWIKCRFIPKI